MNDIEYGESGSGPLIDTDGDEMSPQELSMRDAFRGFDRLSPEELAYDFKAADQRTREIYKAYIHTKPEPYRAEFRGHLDDDLLGEFSIH